MLSSPAVKPCPVAVSSSSDLAMGGSGASASTPYESDAAV